MKPAAPVTRIDCIAPCYPRSIRIRGRGINDVAAEVARLTATLEGPGSPIESMLAAAVPSFDRGSNGRRNESGATIEPPQQGKGTLADRIRALQSGASRVASN